ncbi:hypothetical protein HCN44_006400 [Aphidius gifuensis]|uniref:Uncharacterized protein n=1 Tax=Aphidius gifuensis TaxID=684658 RepID=A0A834XW92_APHGI|nr:uncharacterized protein LOC122852288 [Aphidius gifuensis]KAF7993340.1 hypothetical protein HCN44_006400 [Aphidius gifuensis]
MMGSNGWKVIQQHIPMIRFRKGLITRVFEGATTAQSAVPGPSTKSTAGGATGPGVIALPTIEDFQLPLRYQRRQIADYEIAYINRGGPD